MKKISLAIISLILAALFLTLTGCEMKINLEKEPSTKASLNDPKPSAAETAVVEITDENGSVVATEAVTLSSEEEQIKDDFFKPGGPNQPTKGPSSDRVDGALNNQTTTKTPEGNISVPDSNAQDDAAVLNSNQYMIVVRLVDNGEDVVYKIARNGKKSSMMFDYDGQEMGLIIDESNVYLLSIKEKMYIQAPKSLLEESAKEQGFEGMLEGNPLDFERNVDSKTTEVINGVEYNVVTYKDGIKDYFIGKTIIKTVGKDGSVMYYDSVSPVAPLSIFVPPKDFTKTELTDEGVSEFASAMDTTCCTNPNHKHDK